MYIVDSIPCVANLRRKTLNLTLLYPSFSLLVLGFIARHIKVLFRAEASGWKERQTTFLGFQIAC